MDNQSQWRGGIGLYVQFLRCGRFNRNLLRLSEDQVISKRWLGAGPYRVWQNRIHGTQYDVWENDYNDPIRVKHLPILNSKDISTASPG